MFWQVASDSTTPINFDLAEAGIWSQQEDGSFIFSGNMFSDTWQLSWSTRVDTQTDILLDTLVSVTNTSSTEQWFTATTLLDSIDSSLDQQLLTLASTLTVMNLQFSGSAELGSMVSAPIIGSLVDGVTAGTLFDPIHVLTSVGPFAVATESASMAAITGGVQESLGNTSDFRLTAGDTATLHTMATLTSIPAPGSFVLLTIAAASGRTRRRRGPRHPLGV